MCANALTLLLRHALRRFDKLLCVLQGRADGASIWLLMQALTGLYTLIHTSHTLDVAKVLWCQPWRIPQGDLVARNDTPGHEAVPSANNKPGSIRYTKRCTQGGPSEHVNWQHDLEQPPRAKKAAKGALGSKRLCLPKHPLLHRFGGVKSPCAPATPPRVQGKNINTGEPTHER